MSELAFMYLTGIVAFVFTGIFFLSLGMAAHYVVNKWKK